MIRISQLRIEVTKDLDAKELPLSQLQKKAASVLSVDPDKIISLEVLRRSVDARKKPNLFWTYTVAISVNGNEKKILKRLAKNQNVQDYAPVKYHIPADVKAGTKPVVIGAGPAGLFAAYALALAGLSPILIERGKTVDERTEDVKKFWNEGVLDPTSNVQFGEGGAGTFSDGKLNTLVKDHFGRNTFVLDTFVKFGAPKAIKYDAKPHVGTDILVNVVKNIRNEIIRLGGEVRFETVLIGIEIKDQSISAVTVKNLVTSNTEKIASDRCILAIGHSARHFFHAS